MTESREQLEQELIGIQEWEKDQKDLWFWEKLGRLPFALLDRWTPKGIQEKVGTALNEVGQFIQTGGDYLVSETKILARLREEAGGADGGAEWTVEQVQTLPLEVMDRTAEDLSESRTKIATVQGAATGFGGLFTIAVDIPAMLGLSLKMLQELALCYGFDPKDERERTFMVKCLQFSSSDIVGKKAVLDELGDYDNESKQVQVMSQLQGWREVANAYRDSFGMKKMFQLVPVAGTIFGAYSNREALQQVAETGRMLYRKRRILQRLEAGEAQQLKAGEGQSPTAEE
ncbi:EcsC family protein [Paenibacillus aurantius]|uniref:EcsC family protein n=1 Tax=Paenibacillus aurantius TaxID=2918900 RepID=A0AA96LBB8_9BACL|nr:EcsC family protein [Paenibacillus aurantius]WNQ10764.1 EcsC family protein [Paenibacillus aurantius]